MHGEGKAHYSLTDIRTMSTGKEVTADLIIRRYDCLVRSCVLDVTSTRISELDNESAETY